MNLLLAGREALMRECARLHRLIPKAVRSDSACRLLMTMPGIGPVSALTFAPPWTISGNSCIPNPWALISG
ncbi:hypothetical protein [Bradyrhizobium sp. CCGB20]|uniref:hypothetical protein n=1 Tax=Bradyrhizobium sp. CCGB20 TaxID=2949633 RepID=UPI0020B22AB6|nr:hypothetical protein [Bradyrhizobium sp. CCGB20]MCP3402888.1 hypothetical protein [Bradyrhizobium sp. CCGB20]